MQNQLNNLLSAGSPDQYKSLLFNLQTVLIENGYVSSLTEKGRSEFAALLQALYDFFDQTEGKKK